VLADLGILDVVRTRATEIVHRRVSAVVAGDAFAGWLRELIGE